MAIDSPADPVVLLHGQPGVGADWNAVRARLRDRRVLTPDRPGYGANPAPARGPAGNADWLAERLDQVGVRRAVVVGHSWAGAVAILAAARHPDRVSGLVLVASVGPRCLVWSDRPLAAPIAGPVLSGLGLRVGRPLLRVAGRDPGADPRLPRTFVTEQRALLAELGPIEAALPQVGAPTVVLAGDRDRVVPALTARLLAARIPGARRRSVPGAGHRLPRDAPAAIVRAVLDLDDRAGGGRS